MGFLSAYTRKMYLTDYTNKLQMQLTDITSQKMNLTDTISQLVTDINDMGDPDSPAVKQLEARRVQLENLEKKLDLRMQKIQTKLQAASTEMQSLDGMISSGIKNTFSYNVGG